jgi:hypothetical protein
MRTHPVEQFILYGRKQLLIQEQFNHLVFKR